MWDYVVIPAASPDGGQLVQPFHQQLEAAQELMHVCVSSLQETPSLDSDNPQTMTEKLLRKLMQMEDTWVASEEATLTWLTESQWKFWRI